MKGETVSSKPASFVAPDVDVFVWEPPDEQRPTLAAIKAHIVPAIKETDRDGASRRPLRAPSVIREALDTLKKKADVSLNDVANWAWRRGLLRFHTLPDVARAIEAAGSLIEAGRRVPPLEFESAFANRERLDIRNLSPTEQWRFGQLRATVRLLPQQSLPDLVLCCGLVDAPLPRADVAKSMLRQLDEFQRILAEHADYLKQLADDATGRPQHPNELRWADALRKQ